MKHVMLDLETWGLIPGSDIRSIGAVIFDPITGTLGREFYVATNNPWRFIHPDTPELSRRKWSLSRDPGTEKWWSDQSPEAQAAFENPTALNQALAAFHDWLPFDEYGLWANGPHFDVEILAACYRAVGQPVPWSHRAPRDCRTIWEAAQWPEIPFEGTEHNALDDAKHQARRVIAAYRTLGIGDAR